VTPLSTFDPGLSQNAQKIKNNDLQPGFKVSDMINFARHSRRRKNNQALSNFERTLTPRKRIVWT